MKKHAIEVKRARCHECGRKTYKLRAVRLTVLTGLDPASVTHPVVGLCPKHLR